MTQYFYLNGTDKFGPFNLEEIKQKNLSASALVWHEGLNDWIKADQVSVLTGFLKREVPYFVPESENNSVLESKVQLLEYERTKFEKILFFGLIYCLSYKLIIFLFQLFGLYYPSEYYFEFVHYNNSIIVKIINIFTILLQLVFLVFPILAASCIKSKNLKNFALIIAIIFILTQLYAPTIEFINTFRYIF